MSVVFLLLAGLLLGGCANAPAPQLSRAGESSFETGIASYYHDSLHGNPTASGTPYDRESLTAAHRTLPFGTRIRVTNQENGRTLVLTVNDRGPFVAGRIVDVSRRAARELGFERQGLVRVTLTLVD